MAASPPAGDEIGVAQLEERPGIRDDLVVRSPTPFSSLVLLSLFTSLAWELWPEPRTVALSTRFSVVCECGAPAGGETVVIYPKGAQSWNGSLNDQARWMSTRQA
jgi:hypothetical protein